MSDSTVPYTWVTHHSDAAKAQSLDLAIRVLATTKFPPTHTTTNTSRHNHTNPDSRRFPMGPWGPDHLSCIEHACCGTGLAMAMAKATSGLCVKGGGACREGFRRKRGVEVIYGNFSRGPP